LKTATLWAIIFYCGKLYVRVSMFCE